MKNSESQFALIIGNGIAGATAAMTMRESGYKGKIVAVSSEPWPVYYRTRLPELIAGEITMEKLIVTPVEKFTEKNIDLRLGVKVTDIDAGSRTAKLDNGEKFGWDILLLATGCNAFIPPIKGCGECKTLFSLRTAADAEAIRKAALGKKCAMCIGGGALGLETAFNLAKLGLAVDIVEVAGRLLPKQLDSKGAAVLQKLLENKGFRFHLGATVDSVADGRVILTNGEVLNGDLQLVSAGVAPRTELAKALGIAFKRGIIINERCLTNVNGIYAAGDNVEYSGRTWGTWLSSRHWGKLAGSEMAGIETHFSLPVESFRLKLTGIDLLSIGEKDLDEDADKKSLVSHVIASNLEEGIYHKIVESDGKVVGAVLLGACAAGRIIERAVNEHFAWKELAAAIGVNP